MKLPGLLAIVLLACAAFTTGTCTYELRVPPDLDVPGTPHFDTTIVRTANCSKHLLRFPPQGTETEYTLSHDTVKRSVHFTHDEVDKQWLDITHLPSGTYNVHLQACGNGGFFTLRIE
jgi:hypothetical protein